MTCSHILSCHIIILALHAHNGITDLPNTAVYMYIHHGIFYAYLDCVFYNVYITIGACPNYMHHQALGKLEQLRV